MNAPLKFNDVLCFRLFDERAEHSREAHALPQDAAGIFAPGCNRSPISRLCRGYSEGFRERVSGSAVTATGRRSLVSDHISHSLTASAPG
jgi:hypothetical protein